MYTWSLVQYLPAKAGSASGVNVDVYTNAQQAYETAFDRIARQSLAIGAAGWSQFPPQTQQDIEDKIAEIRRKEFNDVLVDRLLGQWNPIAATLGDFQFFVSRTQEYAPTTLEDMVLEATEQVQEALRNDPEGDYYGMVQEIVPQVVPTGADLFAVFWHERPDVDLEEAASILGSDAPIAHIIAFAVEEDIKDELSEEDIRTSVPPIHVTSQEIRTSTGPNVTAGLHIISILRRYLWSTTQPFITDYPATGAVLITWPLLTDFATVVELGRQLEPCQKGSQGDETWNPSYIQLLHDPLHLAEGFLWRLVCSLLKDVPLRTIGHDPIGMDDPLYREDIDLVRIAYTQNPLRDWDDPTEEASLHLTFQLADENTGVELPIYIRLPIWIVSTSELEQGEADEQIEPPHPLWGPNPR